MTLQKQLLAGQIISLAVMASLLTRLVHSPLYIEESMPEAQEPVKVEQEAEVTEVRFPVIMWAGDVNQRKSYELPAEAFHPVIELGE